MRRTRTRAERGRLCAVSCLRRRLEAAQSGVLVALGSLRVSRLRRRLEAAQAGVLDGFCSLGVSRLCRRLEAAQTGDLVDLGSLCVSWLCRRLEAAQSGVLGEYCSFSAPVCVDDWKRRRLESLLNQVHLRRCVVVCARLCIVSHLRRRLEAAQTGPLVN